MFLLVERHSTFSTRKRRDRRVQPITCSVQILRRISTGAARDLPYILLIIISIRQHSLQQQQHHYYSYSKEQEESSSTPVEALYAARTTSRISPPFNRTVAGEIGQSTAPTAKSYRKHGEYFLISPLQHLGLSHCGFWLRQGRIHSTR